jgi:hypothetical protein
MMQHRERRPLLRRIGCVTVWAMAFALGALPLHAQQTHVVIVTGLGGEPRWRDEFHEWGAAVHEAAVKSGVPATNIAWLAERADRDARIRARSTAEGVAAALVEVAVRAGENDQLFLLLAGHGSFDGRESKLNLPGPSPTAEMFAAWLAPFTTQQVVVVNTASASGGFREALAAPNRTIVTATRSGREGNEAVFGRFFVRAYADDVADIDKDGRVSVLEAFRYAVTETDRFYTSQNRLKTEHAVMDDGGIVLDGAALLGEAAAAAAAPNAPLASGFFLAGRGAVPVDASPEMRALLEQKARLEREIDMLRARRSSMEESVYEAELERLLVELARTNQRVRQAGGGT